MKNIQTCFQHFIQRIDTSKGELQLDIPVIVFFKGLLDLVKNIGERKTSSDQ